MGLNVNATRLATISDNIANSATYGYKRSEADFSSLVLNQRSSVYTAGGVRVSTYKDIADQGALISTGNSTDIAISGNGMIPVTTLFGASQAPAERDFLMIPTGSFLPDANGNLSTQSGMYLLGWEIDAAGVTQTNGRDGTSGLVPVNVDLEQLSATPTRNINLGLNLPADATDAGGTGEAFTLPVEYFDNLGGTATLTYTFTPNVPATGSSNSWSVAVTDSAGTAGATIAAFDITFNDTAGNGGSIASVTAGAGATYDAATGQVSFNVASGPMNALVGEIGGTSAISQFASGFSPTNVTKDGSPIGELQTVEISEQGFVEAIFTSGVRRALYQIPVVDVPNINGLTAQNNQAYSISQDSGGLYLWDAGSGPVGGYASYALMQSNTDIASELTSLIETQRAYSSNAKIIQTVDEMLQETTNLKR